MNQGFNPPLSLKNLSSESKFYFCVSYKVCSKSEYITDLIYLQVLLYMQQVAPCSQDVSDWSHQHFPGAYTGPFNSAYFHNISFLGCQKWYRAMYLRDTYICLPKYKHLKILCTVLNAKCSQNFNPSNFGARIFFGMLKTWGLMWPGYNHPLVRW